MFSFGKSKAEARITGEFYTNAIHVMEGATLLADGELKGTLPQCGLGQDPASFKVSSNYVALPAIEAFRIEYWAMEEAKIRRQPPEKELSRRIALIVGGGNGIGREVALLAAERGAHVVVADLNESAASTVAAELKASRGHRQIHSRHHRRIRRPRHPHQHRSALSLFTRRRRARLNVGYHARHQCHGQLPARR